MPWLRLESPDVGWRRFRSVELIERSVVRSDPNDRTDRSYQTIEVESRLKTRQIRNMAYNLVLETFETFHK